MWYYVAGVLIVSKIADIITVSEKIYGVCHGLYNIMHYGKNIIYPNKTIKYNNDDENEEEWVELKLLKNQSCQTSFEK